MNMDAIERALSISQLGSNVDAKKADACEIELWLSFFFDGFGHDEGRKSISEPTISNLGKLFFAHKPKRPIAGIHRFYYEGLGAKFPQRLAIAEPTSHEVIGDKSTDAAKGQVEGAAKKVAEGKISTRQSTSALMKGALKETASGKNIAKTVGSTLTGITIESWDLTRDTETVAGVTGAGVEIRINQALDDLKQVLAEQGLKICTINIAVFGYDRGAAMARGFVNKVIETYRDKKTGNLQFQPTRNLNQQYPARVRLYFMGLIDSVSSAAEDNPIVNQIPFFKSSIKDRIKLDIPKEVERVVHLAAAHELRFFQRIDQIETANCKHYIYPGCQEDVGGGLIPNVQGRSNDFAKIPARRMLAEAYRAGVPMFTLEQLQARASKVHQAFVHIDTYPVGTESKSADTLYFAYRTALKGLSDLPATSANLLPHMLLYVRWLALRYGSGALPSDKMKAWAIEGLREEVGFLRYRAKHANNLATEVRFRALDATERQLLQAWDDGISGQSPLAPEVVALFDHLLHDSVLMSQLNLGFQDFWRDVSGKRSLYLRLRPIELLKGPGFMEKLREQNLPYAKQRTDEALRRTEEIEERGRAARQVDRERAGIYSNR